MKLKNNRETWMDSASVAKSVSKKTSKHNFRGQVVKHTLHLPVIETGFDKWISISRIYLFRIFHKAELLPPGEHVRI